MVDDWRMQIAIRLDDVSPPIGEAAIDDAPPQAFVGWLGLLSILDQAMRSDVAGPAGQRGEHRCRDEGQAKE